MNALAVGGQAGDLVVGGVFIVAQITILVLLTAPIVIFMVLSKLTLQNVICSLLQHHICEPCAFLRPADYLQPNSCDS